MLETYVGSEGEPEVLQFSGGGPTIHPDLCEFVAMAKQSGDSLVMHLLAAQLPEWPRVSDFVPVPCCVPARDRGRAQRAAERSHPHQNVTTW